MTQDQTLAFAVLAGMMVVVIRGRLRYDLVAVLALLASVITGCIQHVDTYSGRPASLSPVT
ncbi:hypothetical protein [Microvirga massiliensis]|uniref:hypothetical protein n=1 Tax=Microvirga massiliensis TaxID=1033741 RepID=UPI0011CB3F0F|nr:hypothetical protein [Microvirga massiliensis]